MVDLNGHEAGNGGHSQGKPKAYRDSSTRRDARISTLHNALDTADIVRDACYRQLCHNALALRRPPA